MWFPLCGQIVLYSVLVLCWSGFICLRVCLINSVEREGAPKKATRVDIVVFCPSRSLALSEGTGNLASICGLVRTVEKVATWSSAKNERL